MDIKFDYLNSLSCNDLAVFGYLFVIANAVQLLSCQVSYLLSVSLYLLVVRNVMFQEKKRIFHRDE